MERDAERGVDWVHLPVIATVARLLCRELTLQNEYLLLENRTLKSKILGRLRFTDEERRTLSEAALAMGRSLMKEVVSIVRPETILAWQGRLERQKSKYQPCSLLPALGTSTHPLVFRRGQLTAALPMMGHAHTHLPPWAARAIMPLMKVRALVRRLEQDGWVLIRTRGDHRQFAHPERGGVVTVSGNLGRDIPLGTLNAMLKAAGLKREDR